MSNFKDYYKNSLKIPKGLSEAIKYNCQMKKPKRTNNDLLNITQKTKGRATQTQLKTCSTCGTCRLITKV
jgi:hypothetical protein